ncbi:hypothetical protein FQR65_LT10120 [Abscondita terminalis]|nr:hypothetical protein FQR65_LT10120 [Abscondita terminalis]
MFRLRQTWNDVIPPKKLYALDVQITQLDPAWPVTAPPPSSIHFNPKFLKTTSTTVSDTSTAPIISKSSNALMTNKNTSSLDPKTLSMQQKLINKQKELLELQQRKLQLELLQTQFKLQEQQILQHPTPLPTNKTITHPITNMPHSQNLLLKPEVAKQMASSKNSLGKSKSGQHLMSGAKSQNSSGATRISSVSSNLANARPIRDPRLLRQQQQHQQQQPQQISSTVNTNNLLESKSKSGTQVTVDSDNKIVNNKTSVRNDRIEHRLVNNKGNIESHGKSKTLPHSSPLKHTQKIGSSLRKGSKFSRDSKISSSPSDISDSKTSLNSPSKSGRSEPLAKTRLITKSFPKIKKKSADKDRVDEKVVAAVCSDKNNSEFRIDKDSVNSNRVEKKSEKHLLKISKSGKAKLVKSDGSFKDPKGSIKNRNYVRRNRNASISPEPNQDVDLRVGGPPEKQPRIQGDNTDDKNGCSDTANMDVDLRLLPSVINKKRTSTDTQDSPNAKKSRSEMFDVLFGSEDTDLRQLPPMMSSPKNSDRPPTPPPPIISDKCDDYQKSRDERKDVGKNVNLDALRAKLANAVNQNKIKDSIEFDGSLDEGRNKLNNDLDMRKLKGKDADNSMSKIIISAADEESIKTGNMSEAQKKALVNKILAQIETHKLREAQRKESESIGGNSLQPISDEEPDFSCSDSDDDENRKSSYSKDKDSKFREEKAADDRIPPIPPQISQLEGTYPPFTRSGDQRDPRRGRLWRGRQRKNWEFPTPMSRPGIRPGFRAENWGRPMDSWRSMGPPQTYSNSFPVDHIGSFADQGSQSPNSSQDIPTLEYAHPDSFKFITIDNEPREIRYYDETAIVFMDASDPREITFHNGTRRIFFDGEPYLLKLNSSYEEIPLKGNIHKVRLGAPSREIFIDGKGYECYFDQNEKVIDLDGNKIVVKLEPPPPQVKIGQEKRLDLVAGKVQLVVDAKNMYTIFLDAKPQTFELNGVKHTLKFVDSLRAALINDLRFEIEYGGLPKPIFLHEKKHFVRFSVLPKGIKPGHVNIKDMEVIQPSDNAVENEASQLLVPDNVVLDKPKPFEGESPDRNSNSPHHFLTHHNNFNNLDMLSSVIASSMVPSSSESGYQVEDTSSQDVSQSNIPPPPTSNTKNPTSYLNINDLFQRLVATGIVTTASPAPIVEEPPPASPPKFNRNLNNFKNMKPVVLNKPETLKQRRQPVITMLYNGMQCSSCGMRFPPGQSIYYSQHLDWHFRQNRKGKKNVRKAASRRWYYTLLDWKNYEEIEDLEEREKNYFENQQNSEGLNDEPEEEVEIPCVPADPNVQDASCEVCRDKFEQFFNEEKDEWQLRMAVRVDGKTYHPLCYEDYQASLVDPLLEESKLSSNSDNDQGEVIPGLETEQKSANETFDDVMEVIENIDDEDTSLSEEKVDNVEVDDSENVVANEEEDDDVIINEVVPERIVLDDDDKDDYSEGSLIPGVVVKEEPIDDGFMDVEGGLVRSKEIKIKTEGGDNDETELTALEPQTVVDVSDTTHIEVVSTIDGNVEFESGTNAASTGISGKIKINITKPIPAIVPKENKDIVEEELKNDFIDPSQPLPPGEEPVQLNIKPALQGLDLKRQPMVKKGSELTGLCSIM